MNARASLLALALGAFGIGFTEFAPMGMLPSLARELDVSLPTAGLLISAYAIGVVIGAPLILLFPGRLSRRTLLILSMSVFTTGNVLAALSQGYAHLMFARILTALNQAPFFGVGAVVAASLVPKDKQAAAVATMFTGLAVANIGGVPLAVWLDATLGWRLSFWGMAVIGLATMGSLWFALPATTGLHAAPRVRDEISVFRRSSVLIALVTTIIFSITLFTVFTFIRPILAQAGATPREVSLVLVLFGVSLTVGNWLGGRFADRSADGTLIVTFVLIAAALCLLAVSMSSLPIATAAIAVWGAAAFASTSPLQLRVMSAAVGAPSLASTANIGAFNLGNALGAAIGSAVIALHLGLPALCFAGAGFALLGAIMILTVARSG
jgi:MFS transporter, DHA1 family, inner membrane transport protein